MGKFCEKFEKKIRDAKDSEQIYYEEVAFIDIAEMILEKMEEKGITKADLAKKLGVSRAAITQLLNGSRNLTLKSIIAIMFHLDLKLKITAEPLSLEFENEQDVQDAIEPNYTNSYVSNIAEISSNLKANFPKGKPNFKDVA